jgi:hypothetical protein
VQKDTRRILLAGAPWHALCEYGSTCDAAVLNGSTHASRSPSLISMHGCGKAAPAPKRRGRGFGASKQPPAPHHSPQLEN